MKREGELSPAPALGRSSHSFWMELCRTHALSWPEFMVVSAILVRTSAQAHDPRPRPARAASEQACRCGHRAWERDADEWWPIARRSGVRVGPASAGRRHGRGAGGARAAPQPRDSGWNVVLVELVMPGEVRSRSSSSSLGHPPTARLWLEWAPPPSLALCLAGNLRPV